MTQLTELNLRNPDITNDKITAAVEKYRKLISLLQERNVPTNVAEKINKATTELNASLAVGWRLVSLIQRKQGEVIKLVEKEMKLVPKKYYTTIWTALGMTAFGLPIGVALGLSLDNLALLAIGLPIGLGFGALLGSSLDKKAEREGRQLDIDYK